MGERLVHEGCCRGLEWAAHGTPFPGQCRSGDGFLVSPTEAGALVAVVDALGHGDEAADVAEVALASLRHTAGQPPLTALTACHAALQGGRGAAVTLVEVDVARRRLAWVAVGNVDAAVVGRGRGGARRERWSVPLRAGVVGDRLPPLRESTLALPPRGVLVTGTDGMATAFVDAADPSMPVAELAQRLHEGHARADDDALVLVARYG